MEKMFTGQTELEQDSEITVRIKTFRKSEAQFAGDCTMDANMTVVFRSDGTGNFDAPRVRSTDDDDTWEHQFIGRRSDGSDLFRLDKWKKEMPDDDTWYDWNVDFTYDAGHFDALQLLGWEYSC